MKNNTVTVKIHVCGAERISESSPDPKEYFFGINKGNNESLVKLEGALAYSDWFNSSDPLCPVSNYSLESFETVNGVDTFSSFNNSAIVLDTINKDLLVKLDSGLNVNFVIKAITPGGIWAIKKFKVQMCGRETVEFKSPFPSIDISYGPDSELEITNKTILEGMQSTDPIVCPVINFTLKKDLEKEQTTPVRLLDEAIILGSDLSPGVTFDF